MNLPRWCALLATLLAIIAFYGWASDDVLVTVPGPPHTVGAPVEFLEASVPAVSDFKHFYVNDLNPFVPLKERGREVHRLSHTSPLDQRPPRTPTGQPVPVDHPDDTLPALRPPAQVEVPHVNLPRLTQVSPQPPHCLGYVASAKGGAALVIRMADEPQDRALRVGETIEHWTLLSIRNGMASFTDPAGHTERFVIATDKPTLIEGMGQGQSAPIIQP